MICVVSDHGFARVDRLFKLDAALVRAGLIQLKNSRDTLQASGIASWTAQAWGAGGSAAIVLRDPADSATRDKVRQVLTTLAADTANGIASILESAEIAKLGGSARPTWWIDLRPGVATSASLDGPLSVSTAVRGTHGYSPNHREMASSFFIAGGGVPKGVNLGSIDMRAIAPTIAQIFGSRLPSAEVPPLVFRVAAAN